MSGQDESSFEYHATEHFRASGVYWGLGALHLLRRPQVLDAADIKAWVLSCQKPSGAFGGSPRHDGHLLYTLSALQILALLDDLDAVDGDQIAECACRGLGLAWPRRRGWCMGRQAWIHANAAGSPADPGPSATRGLRPLFLHAQTWRPCSKQTAPLPGTSGAKLIPGAEAGLAAKTVQGGGDRGELSRCLRRVG